MIVATSNRPPSRLYENGLQRDTLMPVLSLRGLLGFGASGTARDREKVIVMKFGGEQIGLVADQARSIVSADPDLMDPIPPILAARTGGESRIRSVYRGEAGRRLISILSPDQMFREDVMQKLPQHQGNQVPSARATDGNREELIFLVFRLGDDESCAVALGFDHDEPACFNIL